MNTFFNYNKLKENNEINCHVNLHEAIWITFFSPLHELLLISDLISQSTNDILIK